MPHSLKIAIFSIVVGTCLTTAKAVDAEIRGESQFLAWARACGLDDIEQIAVELRSESEPPSDTFANFSVQARSLKKNAECPSIMNAFIVAYSKSNLRRYKAQMPAFAASAHNTETDIQWDNVFYNIIGLPVDEQFNSRLAAERYADWILYSSPGSILNHVTGILRKPAVTESDIWFLTGISVILSEDELQKLLISYSGEKGAHVLLERLSAINIVSAISIVKQSNAPTSIKERLWNSVCRVNPIRVAAEFVALTTEEKEQVAVPLAKWLSNGGVLTSWQWLTGVENDATRKACVDIACINAHFRGGDLELTRTLANLPASPERNSWIRKFLEENSSKLELSEVEAWSNLLSQ